MRAFDDVLHLIAAERYTARPLPPYRFLPAATPHPSADPRGHSYRLPGTPPPSPPLYPGPARWRECETWLFGCDLYNHGYWWEAHEAWESLWMQCAAGGRDRRLLQGLIQAANCHLKLRMLRMKAVHTLRARYRDHLSPLARETGQEPLMGLALGRWLAGLEAYYDRRAQTDGSYTPHAGDDFPFLILATARLAIPRGDPQL